MEPPKANTVWIVKILLPCVQLVRPCNSSEGVQDYKMERINQTIHYYLSYPIYGSNQRHKTNNVKNDTLFKV